MNSEPLTILISAAIAIYTFFLWFSDYKAYKKGKPIEKPFPGATNCRLSWIFIAILGSLLLVFIETAGEYALGISSEQSDIPALFLISMIAAGFIEEFIFRGYLIVENKGKKKLILSAIGFSLIFALIHFHLFEIPEDGTWLQAKLTLNNSAVWWTLILFINSLWFYYLRFSSKNKERSLFPCIAAHASSNLFVFLIKLFQGHVVGLW